MNKLTRLSLLVLLLVTLVFAPSAFGAKLKGGKVRPSGIHGTHGLAVACPFVIDCGDGGDLIPCCGSYDYCVGYCDGTCGGGPGSCA
jgi:hypothetical protein